MIDEEKTSQKTGVFLVKNSTPQNLLLVLEFWGDEHVIAPGGSLRIRYKGPAESDVEIEAKADRLIIYGWTGSLLEVQGD